MPASYYQRFKTPAQRFWEKVSFPVIQENCWEWTAGKNPDGYAVFRGLGERRAGRAAWKLVNGDIPSGKLVCHRCDNPGCVNPNHLFLGSPLDNMLDKTRKKRNNPPVGERAGRAKLTTSQVLEIRARHAKGDVQRHIAKDFGVGFKAINKIVFRQRWKHV